MIDSMLERHTRYGWSTPSGEWGAIQAEDRKELHAALDAGDRLELEALLDDMLNGPLAFGLVSMGDDPRNQLEQAVLWRLALWAKCTPSPDLSRLTAPTAGNPMTLTVSDVSLMVDTARFDLYASRIMAVNPTKVLEIGCGYGGTALQLLRQSKDVRVVLVDIPETLYLAGYWLSKSTDRTVAWWDENPNADVVLLPACELEQWKGGVDLVFAGHTLSGLDRPTIAHYMAWLGASEATYFYHDDATEAVAGIWLTDAFPEVLASEIAPSGFTLKWQERTPWTGLTDRFCEFFYERAA